MYLWAAATGMNGETTECMSEHLRLHVTLAFIQIGMSIVTNQNDCMVSVLARIKKPGVQN